MTGHRLLATGNLHTARRRGKGGIAWTRRFVYECAMITVILVAHVLLALALVGVILLQRSEGGALGIGGGGSGGGMMSGRGAASLLTRATAIAATLFFVTSLALSILVSGDERGSIVDDMALPQEVEAEADPSVPVAE